MSDKDDPFGLSGDAGRTRIRPVRGGQAPATAQPGTPAPPPQPPVHQTPPAYAPPPPAQPAYVQPPPGPSWGAPQGSAATASPRVRHARAHANPLVASFAALLELAPELERAAPPAQPSVLRARMQDNLLDARDAAVGMGMPLTRADQGAWFVAALIDDIALNTPWGGNSDWPRQPLVTALSGEVDAGTRFYDRLEELMRNPNRDPQLLELGYLCLGLGFRGKYRVQGGAGEAPIGVLRGQIARLLRDVDAEGGALSPHWQGVAAPDEPRRFAVPLWTIGLGAGAILTALYIGLGMQLSSKAQQLYSLAALIPPAERAEVFRPVRETAAPPPEIVVEPVVIELLPEFAARIPPERLSTVKGREDTALTMLAIQGTDPELFRSAKADVNDPYLPVVAAIAAVIAENPEVIGKVTVTGHTDSVPVQRSNPFASNQGLSEARAAAIAALLVEGGVPAGIVASEGRADAEPVGDNATREGRAQNRRVEIKIEKRL